MFLKNIDDRKPLINFDQKVAKYIIKLYSNDWKTMTDLNKILESSR